MKLTQKIALKIARLTAQGKYQEIIDILDQYPAHKKGSWGHLAQTKLIPFLKNPDVEAPFTIFTKGNSKLPFFSFSNLPLVNCPGKGDCAKWCYSLKAWQYPAAFYRQVQNTVLVRRQSHLLTKAWYNLPKNVDIRLYVDGDFDSLQTMKYWFGLMFQRPDLKVYGYSKSWEIFLQYEDLKYKFPHNYVLNLSSGSKYENFGHIRARMKNLSVTRGEFIALSTKEKTDKSLREVAKTFGMKRLFVCPGKCGTCLKVKGKNVHACGSKLLDKTNILIQTH